jgi:hypothetical protein
LGDLLLLKQVKLVDRRFAFDHPRDVRLALRLLLGPQPDGAGSNVGFGMGNTVGLGIFTSEDLIRLFEKRAGIDVLHAGLDFDQRRHDARNVIEAI